MIEKSGLVSSLTYPFRVLYRTIFGLRRFALIELKHKYSEVYGLSLSQYQEIVLDVYGKDFLKEDLIELFKKTDSENLRCSILKLEPKIRITKEFLLKEFLSSKEEEYKNLLREKLNEKI